MPFISISAVAFAAYLHRDTAYLLGFVFTTWFIFVTWSSYSKHKDIKLITFFDKALGRSVTIAPLIYFFLAGDSPKQLYIDTILSFFVD